MGLSGGDRREDDAARAGSVLGDLWRQVVDGILQALGDAVRDALGPGGPAMAWKRFRRRLSALLNDARRRSRRIITDQIRQAVAGARAELRETFPRRSPQISPEMVRELAAGLVRQLEHVQVQAERATEDVFKRAVAAVMTPRPGISEDQRLKNAQRVLDDLTSRGITAYVDRAGRHWELASYVEMATRTAVSRTLVNIQLTAYTGLGHDAVLVVSRTLEAPCPRCRPYDGAVLSITGKTAGQRITVTPWDAPARTERVVATLHEAMARGLLHPNCRHTLVPYADGQVMTPADLQPPPAAEYEAEQRQRALERRVRAARRRQAVAVHPGEQTRAKRRVAAAQRAAREHAATHGIPRRLRRERIDVAR
ncbi:phage minor capsid protein [Actinoallomurus sp. NPDC052274]|uniref:phage minor capsid protein n=1 Tax=Actinoallomurus sp. NPDC052274 TaxID=3155420 RepID=UPI00341DD00D